jgi:hypothetical protein
VRPGCEISMHYFSCSGGQVGFPGKACQETLCQTCVFATSGIRESCIEFWYIRGAKRRCTIFRAQVGPVRITQKISQDTIHRTCVFASSVICGSHSAFRCVRAVKCQHTIFFARVGLVPIQQKVCRDTFSFFIRWVVQIT